MSVTYEQAIELLSECNRSELRDHAFGDKEVYFETKDGNSVAEGYSGSSAVSVNIGETEFVDDEARHLLTLGTLVNVERNDAGGDDEEFEDDDDGRFDEEE